MQALATASALPVFAEAHTEPAPAAPGTQSEPPSNPPTADVVTSLHDEVARDVPSFFAEDQLAALERLGEVLMPAGERPGARDARVASFLDFHVGRSPEQRRSLYTAGLDALNAEAEKRYGKPFGQVSDAEAHAILAPLRERWSPETPSDALAAFLRVAKDDVGSATVNSKVYVESDAGGGGGRRRRGVGLYWYTIE